MLEKIKGYISYVAYIVLMVVICILFFSISYSSLSGSSNLRLVIDGEGIVLQNNMEYVKNNLYISYNDAKQVLKDDIFKESALKKIIITANNMIKTYTLNSDVSYTNFKEDEKKDSLKYIDIDKTEYILLSELCDIYGYVKIEDKDLNMVTVFKEDVENTSLKYTRIYGYVYQNSKQDKLVVDKDAKVWVVKNDEYYDANSKYVLCIIEKSTKNVVYILKENLDMQIAEVEKEVLDDSFKTFVQNEDNLKISKKESQDLYYIYSAFKLISSAGDIDKTYDVSVLNGSSYAMITNGFKVANFDSNITSYVLQNMASRQTLITKIAENIQNTKVKGVVVNFRDFKVTSKEYFTQFVKELSMYMHNLGKEVIVYIPLNALYIDMLDFIPYVDNCIVIEYGVKSENSKTSGPDSSPMFIANNIAKLKETLESKKYSKYLNKVVIEIPMYSVLWAEKEQKVIAMQYMYSLTLSDYISKNNLTPVLDETAGQKYVEITKGSLRYKMWLEDEYSINKKIDIAKENNLGGIALYKKGYEPAKIEI